jgi:hypothetical protein
MRLHILELLNLIEISIIGVTIGHSKLDRETQPPTSNFEKFLGKGGRIFYLCKI